MKLSEMTIGDKAIYNGQIVELKKNGKQGGCEYDEYLAYVDDARNDEDNLPELDVIDRDDVSGIEE